MPVPEDDVELAVKLDRLSSATPKLVQGGAVLTVPIPADTNSVQLLLQTQGRPLSARIELLSGPNNVKQVMEVYCEDGQMRPFYSIVQTPGIGNVIRIVNTATVEFPLTAVVEGWDVVDDEEAAGFWGSNGAAAATPLTLEEGTKTSPLLKLGGAEKWGPNFHKDGPTM
jgi:hypothetical protein